ncbi:MAG: branched-chain amino acid ABC transporter permease [Rhizobiales bacterium]|nr:branched-chain amino acid ABC transporter permease [Hyphomicrobiales bacterium]
MFILRAFLDGLSEGGIIALAAIAITLVFRISRFANVAFGDLLTIGAYLALSMMVGWGLPFWPAILLSAVMTGLIGVTSYLVVFKPLGLSTVTLFISSIGLALVFRAGIQLIWGNDILSFPAISFRSVELGPITIPGGDVVVIVTCAIVVAAFFLLLYQTRIGREIRATANDPDLARTTGINVGQVTIVVWLCAAMLVGIAGVLLGASTALQPEMGWNLLLPAFAAAILGGLGNTTGAAIGGLTIGIAMQFAVMFAPAGYKPGVAFAIMILMLLIRPAGLLPSKDRQ